MLLDEVALHVVTQSTRFAVAPSTSKIPIWKGGFRADQPNTAVSLYETGGVAPLYTYDDLELERPALQIISRSTSYVTARANAWYIYEILALTGNANLPVSTSTAASTVNYVTITPNQSPFDMGTDAKARHQISCNYIIEKALSP